MKFSEFNAFKERKKTTSSLLGNLKKLKSYRSSDFGSLEIRFSVPLRTNIKGTVHLFG